MAPLLLSIDEVSVAIEAEVVSAGVFWCITIFLAATEIPLTFTVAVLTSSSVHVAVSSKWVRGFVRPVAFIPSLSCVDVFPANPSDEPVQWPQPNKETWDVSKKCEPPEHFIRVDPPSEISLFVGSLRPIENTPVFLSTSDNSPEEFPTEKEGVVNLVPIVAFLAFYGEQVVPDVRAPWFNIRSNSSRDGITFVSSSHHH